MTEMQGLIESSEVLYLHPCAPSYGRWAPLNLHARCSVVSDVSDSLRPRGL